MSALSAVHADLTGHGWAYTTGEALGLPPPADVQRELVPLLVPDPRGPGKSHTRDVIAWDGANLTECVSIAHNGVDDFSRFWLLRTAGFPGESVASTVLNLTPPGLRQPAGRMSADLFRYSRGGDAGPHQDGFGELVTIWVLGRDGEGAESFLTTLDYEGVYRAPIPAGGVLVFRDAMFLHGVTPLLSGYRDALIFITLKEGQA